MTHGQKNIKIFLRPIVCKKNLVIKGKTTTWKFHWIWATWI